MSALKRPAGRSRRGGGVLRRLRRDDRGAVATVFGILLAGGVLLGMLALVVDVGQLYAEREELQTGADAAALAVAKTCAADLAACTDVSRRNTANAYADSNAKDGAADALTICGSVTGVSDLVPCDSLPASDNLTACLGSPSSGRYLEVRTTTALPDGSTLLPPTFAQALLGNGGYDGARVGACARVAWGAPRAGLAVTFSQCEWEKATGGGTDFPDPPSYPPNDVPNPRYEVVLKLHAPHGNPDCPSGPAGWDRPGGFGWLDDGTTSDCNTDTFAADPGSDTPTPCLDLLDSATSQDTARGFYLPIYTNVSGTGRNATYEIERMEAFVPTGYFFGNGKGRHKASWLTHQDHCSGPDRCIYGYFVNLRLTVGQVGDLETVGATVVSLVG